MKNNKLLFVYGTLKKESSHPMAAFVFSNATFLGTAKMKGSLYEISWYPGAIYNERSVNLVEGSLFSINIEESIFFSALDDYEGISDPSDESNEYIRVTVPIDFRGQEVFSWVYLYNQDINSFRLIENFES